MPSRNHAVFLSLSRRGDSMHRHVVAATLLVCTLASDAPAAEVRVIAEEVSIQPEQTQSFEFGNVPQQGATVLLI